MSLDLDIVVRVISIIIIVWFGGSNIVRVLKVSDVGSELGDCLNRVLGTVWES